MADDIFSEGSLDVIVGHVLASQPEIDLTTLPVDNYQVRAGYTVREFTFPAQSYGADIRAAIEPIVKEAEAKGCPNHFFTALYEAVLNAHQHGNHGDPTKKVLIAYKVDESSIEVGVIDQGTKLNAAFVPFVFRHRRGQGGFIDFYAFSGLDRPTENRGTGTSFMHTYASRVQYFRSESGGLVVHLGKDFKC